MPVRTASRRNQFTCDHDVMAEFGNAGGSHDQIFQQQTMNMVGAKGSERSAKKYHRHHKL